MVTTSDLRSLVTTNFPNNSSQEIDAADLRGGFNLVADLVDFVTGGNARIYPSRAAAVAEGQMPPTIAGGRIITIENDSFVVRGPGLTGNDPLFGTYPSWGVLFKTPNFVDLAGKADLVNSGKMFRSRDGAVAAGQSSLPSSIGLILTVESSVLTWRYPFQNGDDPLFTTSPFWGVVARVDVVSALRDSGILALNNVGGTADAITAQLPAAALRNGITSTSVTSVVSLTIATANTGATEPTLSIDGGAPSIIKSERGAALTAGQLVAGQTYLLQRRGFVWRILAGGVGLADIAGERADRISSVALVANAAGTIALTNVGGTGNAITADFPSGVGTPTFVAGKLFRLTTTSDSVSGAVTITVAGNTRTLLDVDMTPLPSGVIKGGRTILFETTGAQFARLISTAVTQAEVRAWQSVVPQTGIISLANIAGTPDAITADFPTGVGAQTFTAGRLVRLVPVADATIASATLTVGGTTRTIRDADLSVFTAPFLKAGRSYVFETYGSQLLKLASDPVTQAEKNAWDAGTDAKIEVLENAPAYIDGSRALIRFGGRDIMRMYPDGPRLSGSSSGGWDQAGNRGIMAMDQFETIGGHRYPVAMVDGAARKAIIISVYGQSNADVTEMDDTLIWDAPPMPNHVLMLNDVSGARGGLRGWIGVAAPSGSRLIPAREDAVIVNGNRVQSYATAAASRLNTLIGAPYRVFAVRASAVGGQKLIGDAVGGGIWKDSVGNYVRSWLNWTQDIRNMRDSLITLGYEIEAVHICFTHQEADWQTSRAVYATHLTDMIAEREAILGADLPGVPVRWFVDQASGSGYRTSGYLGGAWPVRMAIQDVVQAHNNMTMVMPRYHMRFGMNGGNLETIHHAPFDRINPQGETYAHAMREVIEGREWRCPVPTGVAISGNDVVIDFDSIEPLVLDPGFSKVRPDMGFELWTGSATVPANTVRLSGQRQVTATFPSAPLIGQSVCYAYHRLGAGDVSDEWPLSTGALRDAWEAESLFLPGKKLVRPSIGFELQL